jgi:predicted LPLAT superfamily acyltransferase
MPSWQGKSKGTRLGYRIFIWMLKNLGVLSAYFLLRFVAFYYFLFSRKSSAPVLDLFRRRLGFSRFDSLFKLYKNYLLFGQTLIDKVLIQSGMKNPFRIEFEGEEHLRMAASEETGALLLSAHIGNWEMAGQLLERIQVRVHIVMFDGEHQAIKEYLSRVTGKMNAHIILIKNDLSHIYEISEAFRKKEWVCMHADRWLEGNKTLTGFFLGENAYFPAGPFILASKFKVPVSFVFALKESKLHYHFFASEFKTYEKQEKEEEIQNILHDFAAEMEKKVSAYPEQWFNYYNFWEKK